MRRVIVFTTLGTLLFSASSAAAMGRWACGDESDVRLEIFNTAIAPTAAMLSGAGLSRAGNAAPSVVSLRCNAHASSGALWYCTQVNARGPSFYAHVYRGDVPNSAYARVVWRDPLAGDQVIADNLACYPA